MRASIYHLLNLLGELFRVESCLNNIILLPTYILSYFLQIDKYFKNDSISDETHKAELMICAALAEHNISFRVMDHLTEVFKRAFHDSEIAKGFKCKRSKTAHLIYDVIAPTFEKNLHNDISAFKSSSGKVIFSIIIDETTDINTEKILAIAIMYYSTKNMSATTKFLLAVNLEGETSQDVFDALSNGLKKINLNIADLLGFAADTTNVIFGTNRSVVSKIQAVNPHCVFVKCVCHSVALAVSYACKELPRNIDQVVKDVYNYFSHSSKRQREFLEFQDFVGSDKHNILRHYEIRWLSLHACVNRIIEQWDALKLYFHDQYLLDRNLNAEFLQTNFDDNCN